MEKTLASIGIIVGIINFVILAIYIYKVNRYQKMYEISLAKFNNTANIKDKFVELFARLDDVENKCMETREFCSNIEKITNDDIKKIGIVKYNAYDNTENKLSFALALLDGKDNGIVLNHIYSVHGSNMYIKSVNAGKIKERISEEESLALSKAMEKREIILKEETMPVVKKVNTKNLTRIRK